MNKNIKLLVEGIFDDDLFNQLDSIEQQVELQNKVVTKSYIEKFCDIINELVNTLLSNLNNILENSPANEYGLCGIFFEFKTDTNMSIKISMVQDSKKDVASVILTCNHDYNHEVIINIGSTKKNDVQGHFDGIEFNEPFNDVRLDVSDIHDCIYARNHYHFNFNLYEFSYITCEIGIYTGKSKPVCYDDAAYINYYKKIFNKFITKEDGYKFLVINTEDKNEFTQQAQHLLNKITNF